jgi:hypothetical protein
LEFKGNLKVMSVFQWRTKELGMERCVDKKLAFPSLQKFVEAVFYEGESFEICALLRCASFFATLLLFFVVVELYGIWDFRVKGYV